MASCPYPAYHAWRRFQNPAPRRIIQALGPAPKLNANETCVVYEAAHSQSRRDSAQNNANLPRDGNRAHRYLFRGRCRVAPRRRGRRSSMRRPRFQPPVVPEYRIDNLGRAQDRR